MRHTLYRLLISLSCLLLPIGRLEAKPISVTMISPGASDASHTTGDFWVTVSLFMQAAAQDLGFELEILYGERKIEPMLKHAQDIATRPKKPDYIILVNEKDVGPRLVEALKGVESKIFFLQIDLKDEDYKDIGLPRAKMKNLIGSMVPDNAYAGQAMMESLIKAAVKLPSKTHNLLVVLGDRTTPTSTERERGMNVALNAVGDKVKVKQTVYAEWREDKAYDASKTLFERYPDIDMVFAANDPIAFGAIKAMTEAKRKPGQEVLVTGLNWSQDALRRIGAGEMTSSAGGHFMTGAWALVMLYDYHHGQDFCSSDCRIKFKIFDIIDADNITKYSEPLNPETWAKVDFKSYSKKLNPKVKAYDFRLVK